MFSVIMLPEVRKRRRGKKKKKNEKSYGQALSNSMLQLPNQLHMDNAYAELLFVFKIYF